MNLSGHVNECTDVHHLLKILYCYTIYVSVIRFIIGKQIVESVIHGAKILKRK